MWRDQRNIRMPPLICCDPAACQPADCVVSEPWAEKPSYIPKPFQCPTIIIQIVHYSPHLFYLHTTAVMPLRHGGLYAADRLGSMLLFNGERGKKEGEVEGLPQSHFMHLLTLGAQVNSSCGLKWSSVEKWICVEIAERTLASSFLGQHAKRLEKLGHS